MSINKQSELDGMQKVSYVVALTLKAMREFAKPGMSTLMLDKYGASILQNFGARSAPKLTYGFPGWTCISVNQEIAHGIPSGGKILKVGDLINIDVSAELNGFWADNGGSFVLGEDLKGHQKLVNTSKRILHKAIQHIKGGVKIAQIGKIIEQEAKKSSYKVIKNLSGHGVGRSLHEEPGEITNYYNKHNHTRFTKNSVIAIETFISTKSSLAHAKADGWTLIGNSGGYVAQHEHTIVITDNQPIILTEQNGI